VQPAPTTLADLHARLAPRPISLKWDATIQVKASLTERKPENQVKEKAWTWEN